MLSWKIGNLIQTILYFLSNNSNRFFGNFLFLIQVKSLSYFQSKIQGVRCSIWRLRRFSGVRLFYKCVKELRESKIIHQTCACVLLELSCNTNPFLGLPRFYTLTPEKFLNPLIRQHFSDTMYIWNSYNVEQSEIHLEFINNWPDNIGVDSNIFWCSL